MPDQLSLERNSTAVIVMDYQYDIASRFGAELDHVVEKVALVLQGARQAGIPVIHVTVRFREGYPEVLPRNRQRRLAEHRNIEGSPGAEILPRLAPLPGEVLVTKRRTGPFSTTDLNAVLHAMGSTTLVLMGIRTSGCVLSTVRWAADIDYKLVVVADCCADPEPEVHRVLTEKVFPRQATVVTSQEFLQVVGGT